MMITRWMKNPWAVHVCCVPTAHKRPLSSGIGHVLKATEKEVSMSKKEALKMSRWCIEAHFFSSLTTVVAITPLATNEAKPNILGRMIRDFIFGRESAMVVRLSRVYDARQQPFAIDRCRFRDCQHVQRMIEPGRQRSPTEVLERVFTDRPPRFVPVQRFAVLLLLPSIVSHPSLQKSMMKVTARMCRLGVSVAKDASSRKMALAGRAFSLAARTLRLCRKRDPGKAVQRCRCNCLAWGDLSLNVR